jgi:menaquinol-cytochrome c reductase cytochrome b/c subunit
MTEPRTSLPTPAPEGATPAAPKRSAVPAAPPERRTTEIDKQRVPMAAKPYRLLALVKQDAVVRVQKEPDDTVLTWPHLLSIELFAAAMISVFLLFMGLFINAPLEELANGNVTPVVAKAPWYFHPTVAGVLAPTVILVGAALVPYIDRGPRGDGGSPRPSDRKTGVMLFTIVCGAGLAITFLGAFFRGPGYAWTLPWQGLYFAL